MDDPDFAEHAVGALDDHEARLTRLEEREATREVQEVVDVLSAHEDRLGKLEARLKAGVWRIAGIGIVVGVFIGSCATGIGTNDSEADSRYLEGVAMTARNACRVLAERHNEPLSVCDG